ncbi:MAG TPA: hypothetical protein VEX39_02555 [Thermoleophilaceae bacterium]|nr:hypothetical protein [Thermoleophilaceae bacterium]
MDALPFWPAGTAAVLCVAGPHAIPVSTAVRAGDRRVLLALGGRRETLRRLRRDPAAALCVMAEGLAFTAKGEARVVKEGVEAAPALVVVELAVAELVDHLADGRTEMQAPPAWQWLDQKAAESEPLIRAELEALAA